MTAVAPCPRCGQVMELRKDGAPKAHDRAHGMPCLDQDRCPVCQMQCYLTARGHVRRHPRYDPQLGRLADCPGSGAA